MSKLENWSVVGEGRMIQMIGEVYGDKRWHDGTVIRTSLIKELNLEEGYVQTLNTRYQLCTSNEETEETLPTKQLVDEGKNHD